MARRRELAAARTADSDKSHSASGIRAMRFLAAAASAGYIVGGVMHLARANVPAYIQWGVDGAACGGQGLVGNMDLADIQDPISTFTSLTLLTAVLDTQVVLYGAAVAFASGMLHAYQRPGLSELDHAAAAAAPAVVAFTDVPNVAAGCLLATLWLQYDPNVAAASELIFGLGLGAAIVRIMWNASTNPVRWELVMAAALSLTAALLIKELNGNRVRHICDNDRYGAYADDARHAAWHVNAAVLLWAGTRLFGKKSGDNALRLALAAAVPVLASLLNFYSESAAAWLVATLVSSTAMCAVAVLPKTYKAVEVEV